MRKTVVLIIGFILIINIAATLAISEKNNNLTLKDEKITGKTGFFTVEKKDDRWRFIDPNGEPFFSSGVCHVSAQGWFAPDLGYSPYYRNIIDLYGDEETWANVTHDRLVSWGFNTVAGGDEYILDTGFPYTVQLGLAHCNWTVRDIPDYFSEEWIEQVDQKCKEIVEPLANDTQLIGYFLANELRWGPELQDYGDVFRVYLKKPWDSSGKQFLVEFLKNKYNGDIKAFNRAWLTGFKSFDDLYNVTYLGIFPRTTKSRIDRANFTYAVAEQFFKTCHETIRKYDNNHLLLGARFLSYGVPREVVRACALYNDVISANQYPTLNINKLFLPFLEIFFNFVSARDSLQEYNDITGKPVINSEIHFRALDSGLPNTVPSPLLMPVYLTQWSRANNFYKMMIKFIEKPYAIGYHWYTYMDEPRTGRAGDGENSNIGIVNVKDKPYEILANKMKEINNLARDLLNP